MTPREAGHQERARGVRFEDGWVRRLERFALGLEASALRREGGGGAVHHAGGLDAIPRHRAAYPEALSAGG